MSNNCLITWSNKFSRYQFSQIYVHVIANTPSLDNRQIAANGQFTTDCPQRSVSLTTLSQTPCQVTVPRDRLEITTREVKVQCTVTNHRIEQKGITLSMAATD